MLPNTVLCTTCTQIYCTVHLISTLDGTRTFRVAVYNLVNILTWLVSSAQSRMRKGLLPIPSADWPAEPFRSGFLAALNKMEMPRFTRRYPQLLDPLLKQMLTLVHVCFFSAFFLV